MPPRIKLGFPRCASGPFKQHTASLRTASLGGCKAPAEEGNNRTKVVVVGSCVVDVCTYVQAFPRPGETKLADESQVDFGGKGANQAVQLAKLGVPVRLIGCVGDDILGLAFLKQLEQYEHLDRSGVRLVAATGTGLGIASVNNEGENQITLSLGANAALSRDDVIRNFDVTTSEYTVCQLEVDIGASLQAFREARRHNIYTVLNPAPMSTILNDELHELLTLTDVLVPNQIELSQLISLLGIASKSASFADSSKQVMLNYPNMEAIITTLGSDGVHVRTSPDRDIHIPATFHSAVNTIGAGDCFVGSLVASMACGRVEKDDWAHASRIANQAAGYSVSKRGTQSSFPTSWNFLSFHEQGPSSTKG